MRNARWASLLLFLSLSIAIAASLAAADHQREQLPPVSVEAVAVKDRAYPGEWLEFDLTVRNNKVADDTFRVKVDEENTAWSVLTRPGPLNNVIILGRHSKTFRLQFKDINLKRDAKRPYGIAVTVQSTRSGESYIVQLPVMLLPGDVDLSRLPTDITMSVTVPERVDPRNVYSVRVNLRNNNLKPHKGLLVSLKSSLLDLESSVDLGGNQSKAVDFTVTFPDDQPPVQDRVSFVLVANGTVAAQGEIPLTLVPYRIPFNQTVLVTERFLLRTEEHTLLNDVNVEQKQDFSVPMPLLKGLVSSAEPPARAETVDNVRQFIWTITLQPGETTHVTVRTNYRIYLYAAFLLGVVVFLYYMFKNPVTVVKQAERIKTMEGGIAEMKVVLSIKNQGDKEFQCQLHERLPHMIDHLKREEHGLLQPDKVIRTKQGTVLRWLFDLEPHEERIVMYYVKTKLSVLGGLRIPPAVMKVKSGEMHVTVKSNELDVATE